MKQHAITTAHEALVVGLALAITAPSGAKARLATKLAESFARSMSSTEIERAKQASVLLADAWDREQARIAPPQESINRYPTSTETLQPNL
jgi:hypothetical protein